MKKIELSSEAMIRSVKKLQTQLETLKRIHPIGPSAAPAKARPATGRLPALELAWLDEHAGCRWGSERLKV